MELGEGLNCQQAQLNAEAHYRASGMEEVNGNIL